MRLAKHTLLLAPWLGASLAIALVSLPAIALPILLNLPSRGMPGRREGGGTRGGGLVAIVPKTNLGLTTAAYPRFFWSVPKGVKANAAEFTLYQGTAAAPDGTLVYRTTFSTLGTPGIASLALPADANLPPLEVGKDYHWTVRIASDLTGLNDPRKGFKVEGWVQRTQINATLATQLGQASLRDRAALYAQNGFWYDAVGAIADLRCQNPTDTSLNDSWQALMQADTVQLDRQLANQPLLQTCAK